MNTITQFIFYATNYKEGKALTRVDDGDDGGWRQSGKACEIGRWFVDIARDVWVVGYPGMFLAYFRDADESRELFDP